MDNDINYNKFEHASSISEEFNEKLKALKPNIRHEPAPMKELFGVDVPDQHRPDGSVKVIGLLPT